MITRGDVSVPDLQVAVKLQLQNFGHTTGRTVTEHFFIIKALLIIKSHFT